VIRRITAALACVLVLGACQLRTEVGITVDDTGGGSVQVGVGLDDDALRRAGEVKLDDLRDAGWTVTGPKVEGDRLHWFRASKPFATPAEAGSVMEEIAGKGSPFQDFAITRDHGLLRDRYHFSGTVDFTGGIEQFGDDELKAALDGEPLGEDQAAIEQRLGQSLDRLIRVEVAVRLPGKVGSNAPLKASNGAKWRPGIGDGTVQLVASSSSTDGRVIALSAVAAICGAALIVMLLYRAVRMIRHRS
jgi:hypothetical protein